MPEAKLHQLRQRSRSGRAGDHVGRESCYPSLVNSSMPAVAWADILEAHDQPLYSGKGVALPVTAEPGLQVGPSVVGIIPPIMEWSRHYAGALQVGSEVTMTSDASGS